MSKPIMDSIKGDVTLKWADRRSSSGQIVSEGWCIEPLDGQKAKYIFGPAFCVSAGGGPLAALAAATNDRNGIHWTGKVTVAPHPEHFMFGTEIVCTLCDEECERINTEQSMTIANNDIGFERREHVREVVQRAVNKLDRIQFAAEWARHAISEKEKADGKIPREILDGILAEYKEKAFALAVAQPDFCRFYLGNPVEPTDYVIGPGNITLVWENLEEPSRPYTFEAYWENLIQDEQS